MQGDGEGVEAQPLGAIDQVERGVEDAIDGIVAGVEVKVYFQHVHSSIWAAGSEYPAVP